MDTCVQIALLLQLCFPIIASEFEPETSDLRLIYATGLVRHGTATPGVLLPNDPYTEKWITLGVPEKLTPVGSLQHYKLGVTLRRHYEGLISDIFNPDDIDLLSTPRSRAQLAAHNTMAGFYGLPRKREDFERCSGMVVEPTCEMFPLDTTATFMHREEWINCNRLRGINRRTIGPLRTIAFQENQSFFESLTQFTGFKMTNFNEARIVHEAVETMKAFGLKLPDWATEELLEKVKMLYSKDYDIVFAEREQRRLAGGPTLHIILNTLREKAWGCEKDTPQKMTMLFGHTSSLMSVTKSMSVQLEKTPGWAAVLLFELYESVSRPESFFVRSLFKNSTYVEEFHTLDVPGCGTVCSLEKFVEVLEPMAVSNYKAECSIHPPKPEELNTMQKVAEVNRIEKSSDKVSKASDECTCAKKSKGKKCSESS